MSEVSPTILETTPLSVRVRVDLKGNVEGNLEAPLNVMKYFPSLQDKFYNKLFRRWEVSKRFYHLDRSTYTMHFPRYMLPLIRSDIIARRGDVIVKEIKAKEGKDVKVILKHEPFKPKSEAQRGAIAFSLDESVGPVRAITLDPGLGKTVVTFIHLLMTRKRMLVHSSINMEDWTNRILQWLKIPKEKILLIKGVKALKTLIDNIDEIDPVIIFIPTQTLRNYMNLSEEELEGYPPIEKLFEYLKIHTRVIDEYHLHVETHIKLDMRISVPVTIPLTATLESSSDIVNLILKQHLPKSIRYHGSIPNHVDIYDICYSLNLNIAPSKYTRAGYYSHAALEEFLLKGGKYFNEKIVNRIYVKLLEDHYLDVRKKGHKAVVLVSTNDYGDEVAKILRRRFKGVKVATYFKTRDKEGIENSAEIIVTTLKSGGTGTDIKNLITVVNTVAVRSSPENKQNVGREREIDGVNPRYIFTTWLDVEPQKGYRLSRTDIYKEKARKFFSLKMSAR